MQNFAECIAGKGKFCGRIAAASCAKNYGDRLGWDCGVAGGKFNHMQIDVVHKHGEKA